MNTGIFPRMSMADYQKLEAVSQGSLQLLLDRCPYAGWFDSYLNPNRPPDKPTEETELGSIGHQILLLGARDGITVIDPADHPAKTSGAIPDGWTNQSIRAARDEARASNRLPVLKSRMDQVEAMMGSVNSYIESLRQTQPEVWAAFQRSGGESEVTMVWDDQGVPCRIRPDRIAENKRLIIDAKFTSGSAHPDVWGRTNLVRMGYYTAAAFYRRGCNVLNGITPDYLFLVIETEPPYLCSLIGCDPVAVDLGAEKIDRALRIWRECSASGVWAGYPNQIAYPEIPAYEVNYWAERLGGDPGIPYDISKLFRKDGQ